MPTDRPRIQVTLDKETKGMLAMLAKKYDRSISNVASDLIEEALELHEDIYLSKHSDDRIRSAKKWYSHEEAWK